MKTISFKRIGSLIYGDYLLYAKGKYASLVTAPATIVFMNIVLYYDAVSSDMTIAYWRWLNWQVGVGFVLMILASQIFKKDKDRKMVSFTILVPASPMEKFLSKIMQLPLLAIYGNLLYLIGGVALWGVREIVWGYSVDLVTGVSDMFNSTVVLPQLTLIAMALLFSAVFPTSNSIKRWAVIALLVLTFFTVIISFVWAFQISKPLEYELSDATVVLRKTIIIIQNSVLALTGFVASYFMYKEKEIV